MINVEFSYSKLYFVEYRGKSEEMCTTIEKNWGKKWSRMWYFTCFVCSSLWLTLIMSNFFCKQFVAVDGKLKLTVETKLL